MSTTEVEFKKPANVSAWKKNAVHGVMCPSGTWVEIKVPDLPELIIAGQIPQHLLDAAIGAASEDQEPSVDLIRKQVEFTNTLLHFTLVSPKITAEDAAALPYEDKEFLVSVATRQRDLDALGNHIGGLSNIEDFRRFRELGEFDKTLADF